MFDDVLRLVETAKTTGDFSSFIGLKEDLWFEAKCGNAYNWEITEDVLEFAKDVSAFANADGGFLVMGLLTERVSDEKTDIVKCLDLIDITSFSSKKPEGIVIANVHPKLANFQITTIESKSEKGKGLVVVNVPPQFEEAKPFLLRHVLDENDKRLKSIVFGWIQRSDSDNEPFTIDKLRNWIRHGRSEEVQALLRIEGKVDSIISHRQAEMLERYSPKAKLSDRVQEILSVERGDG